MDKDKSIIEKFTDTVKNIANSASEALKAEEPPKVGETNAAYMPFAAEGLVSDPLLVPPIAALPPRKRTARKAAKRSSARKTGTPKKARKATKTSARGKSKSASRSATRKSAKRTTKAAGKRRTSKRAAKRSRP